MTATRDGTPKSSGQQLLQDPVNVTAANGREAAHMRELAYMELLFFAYRDFIGDPDAILTRYGFGRAHHRVLHFVHRNPGLRVADLLDILKITKQSLARVLKQLVDQGHIVQQAGLSDRRERHLYVTEAGQALTRQLAQQQIARVSAALEAAGPNAEGVLKRFLFAMIGEDQRAAVERLVDRDAAADASQDGGPDQKKNT